MNGTAAIDLALGWLTNSGLRYAGESQIAKGGVMQGYNWRQQSYPFIYSEITGYAVSVLVNAYRWSKDKRYLALAHESAGFLLRMQRLADEDPICGAIPHSLSLPDLEPNYQYYSFDAAMCMQGLLDLYDIRPTLELKMSAQAIGDWLLQRMQQPSGAFWAMCNTAGERPHTNDDVFGDCGCLHAKHAIGLLKLGFLTGDIRYTEAAQRVCDWVLNLQNDEGAFRATEELGHIISHSHCYATEGLLFAYYLLGEQRYLEAARHAGKWLVGAQNRDGSVNIEYKRPWWRMGRRIIEKLFPRRVTDATAQAIRIWGILYLIDGEHRFLDACHRAEKFLLKMQCTDSSDFNAVGGFYFSPGHPMMFTWCTMFAIGALHALEHIRHESSQERIICELF